MHRAYIWVYSLIFQACVAGLIGEGDRHHFSFPFPGITEYHQFPEGRKAFGPDETKKEALLWDIGVNLL